MAILLEGDPGNLADRSVRLLRCAHRGVRGEGLEEVPEKLWLWPFGDQPPLLAVVAQVLGLLVVMAAETYYFVDAVEKGSASLGILASLISLILAPLTTELPEKVNSVVWLGENKDTLTLGNINGVMVFQSTVLVSLGILFRSWSLDFVNVLSAALALLSGVTLLEGALESLDQA